MAQLMYQFNYIVEIKLYKSDVVMIQSLEILAFIPYRIKYHVYRAPIVIRAVNVQHLLGAAHLLIVFAQYWLPSKPT